MQRAREIRRQEVKLKPLPYLPTDTETEVSVYSLLLNSVKVVLSFKFDSKYWTDASYSFGHNVTLFLEN